MIAQDILVLSLTVNLPAMVCWQMNELQAATLEAFVKTINGKNAFWTCFCLSTWRAGGTDATGA